MKHELAQASVQATLQRTTLDNLPPLALGLSMIYTAISIRHALVLPDRLSLPLALAAGAVAILTLIVYLILKRYSLPPKWGHPLVAGIATLAIANNLLHLHLTMDVMVTANLAALLAIAGATLLSTPYYAVDVALALIGWAVAAWRVDEPSTWVQAGFFLIAATVISFLIHILRRRTLLTLTQTLVNLERSKSIHEATLDAVPDLILRVDEHGNISDYRPAREVDLAKLAQGYHGAKITDIFPPDLGPQVTQALEVCLQTSTPQVLEYHSDTDGETKVYETRLIPSGEREALILARDVTARRSADRAARWLATFPDENPYPVLRISEDGVLLYANEASAPLLEMWDVQTHQVLPEEWRSLAKSTLVACTTETTEVEYAGRTISLSFSPAPDSNYINVYGLDITARKRAQMALEESERRLEVFFSQSLDGFFFMMLDEPVRWDDTVDKDAVLEYVFRHQRITKVNDAMLAQYGATPEQFLGLTPADTFTHDIEEGKRLWRELFDQGKLHVQTSEQKLDGTPMFVEGDYVCLHDSAGRITGHFGIQREVTEQKEMIRSLQESEETIRTLLESASEGIVAVDADGIITIANEMAETIFGHEQAQLIGQPLDMLIPDSFRQTHSSHCTGYFEHPRMRTMGSGLELCARRMDGSEFPVDVSLSYVDTKEGPIAMAFVVDITERVEAQQAIKEYSERLEEMVEERTEALRQAQSQLVEQQLLQQEIALAAQVQASLLPRQQPSLDGFDIHSLALPARYVSGDLYDFIAAAPDAFHFVIADISGKGIPAALLSSTARTLVKVEAEHSTSPAEILSNVNHAFYDDLDHAEMFITFIAALLDAQLGRLTYANAGHTEILWWRELEQESVLLPATSIPIGVFKDSPVTEETIILRPGDVLVLYSDGVTEAANPNLELFGTDRLLAMLPENASLSARELALGIVDKVDSFQADTPRSDDLTVIVLKALPRRVPFSYPAGIERLNEATKLIRQTAEAYGSEFAYQIELAASEIISNVIKHAYLNQSGEVRGQITLLPAEFQLDLYDDGESFDITAVKTPDPDQPQVGGYGLAITRQIVDELVYTPATPGGNHWHLCKRVTGGTQ